MGSYKAQTLFELLQRQPWAGPHVQGMAADLVTKLRLVHHPDYIDKVRSGKIENGFGTTDHDHVFAIIASVGGYVHSFETLMATDIPAIFSLTNGFHHAGYDYGGGFCTFNAMMIAAVLADSLDCAPAEHPGQRSRVLILDGDAHFGDGCEDIIQQKNLVNVDYVTTSDLSPTLPPGQDAHDCLYPALKDISRGLYKVVLYQPGADSLIGDTFRVGSYLPLEFVSRDYAVFKACKASGTKVLVNLGGGYGAPQHADTVNAHLSTYQSMVRVFYPDTNIESVHLL